MRQLQFNMKVKARQVNDLVISIRKLDAIEDNQEKRLSLYHRIADATESFIDWFGKSIFARQNVMR
jgi:hypothetical protein